MSSTASEWVLENAVSELVQLATLERETNTYKRQELLKALWQLQQASVPEMSQSHATSEKCKQRPRHLAATGN